MQNINLLFNKLYYDDISFEENLKVGNIKEKRNSLIQSKFCAEDYQKCILPGVSKLYFKTLYPGLLVGTGYAHGISIEEDAKLGFSLDYVTGQPYIPGSSVKGTLKSIFTNVDVIKEIIADSLDGRVYSDQEIGNIIKEIFEGNDVFLDAVVYCGLDAVVYRGNKAGRVLGIDYITPHKDPVKNPIPLQMLKILPDVTLEFRFILKENGQLSADEKLAVFCKILEDFGIGAKTNVGYGRVVKLEGKPKATYPTSTDTDQKQKQNVPMESKKEEPKKLEIGRTYDVQVSNVKGKKVRFHSEGNNGMFDLGQIEIEGVEIRKKEELKEIFTKGRKIKVRYEGEGGKDNNKGLWKCVGIQ